MKQHSIYSILETQYGRLERDEAELRENLAEIRTARLRGLRPLIATLYHDCMGAVGRLNYGKLFERIPKQDAVELRHLVEKTKRTIDLPVFPFTVTRFDQMNRLNAATTKIVLNEVEHAQEIYEVYDLFLFAHIAVTITTVSKTLSAPKTPTDKEIEAIINNTDPPIKQSLLEQHIQTAKQASALLQKMILGGSTADETIKAVTDQSTRRDKNTDDRLVYTQDTRVTGQAVADVIGDKASVFRTVCVHDGKACEDCLQIEAEQEINPVPFDDYLPGVTAPPFHPFCRCSYEVEWK